LRCHQKSRKRRAANGCHHHQLTVFGFGPVGLTFGLRTRKSKRGYAAFFLPEAEREAERDRETKRLRDETVIETQREETEKEIERQRQKTVGRPFLWLPRSISLSLSSLPARGLRYGAVSVTLCFPAIEAQDSVGTAVG
jgi:hypothetical protein